MSPEANYIIVLVTISSEADAAKIANTLIHEKLAACCNIIPSVRSIYAWQGKICDEHECLIIVKTRKNLFDPLQARIKELHSYEIPEIIALPIVTGFEPYLSWIRQNTIEP